MNRSELEAYITETYSAEGEHLFAKYPSFLVFRHRGNRKWFAVIMDTPRKNLGLAGEGEISVVNLKCDTRLIGSFREEPGIFPPSSHLILCRPLLLLPSILPSIRVFSNESTLRMRWPKYWSSSFSIIPSKEHQD